MNTCLFKGRGIWSCVIRWAEMSIRKHTLCSHELGKTRNFGQMGFWVLKSMLSANAKDKTKDMQPECWKEQAEEATLKICIAYHLTRPLMKFSKLSSG